LEDKRNTHAERTPNAQLTLGSDGSGYTVTCSDLEGAKTIIDKSLKTVWERREQVSVQELTRIVRVWDIFGNSPKSGIIVHAT
jgi:hypothetical protein